MKTSKSQSGSAHLIIIIILVVALLGALGFVFWQNFVNKTDVVSGNTSSNKTITIKEWGVKGTYSGDTIYNYTFSEFGSLSLTSSLLSTDCADSVGYITRATANEDAIFGSTSTGFTAKEAYDGGKDSWGSAHVGDYYYFLVSPQAGCGPEGSRGVLQDEAFDATTELIKSLEAN